MLFCGAVYSQIDKKKEEINISSSFKPSIIKANKIEFRPEFITRDTSSYTFKYEGVKLSFTTPMSGFTIKPLAYLPLLAEVDSNQAAIQLGYGNLHAPQGALSYSSARNNQSITANADYLSMKGKLTDQHHSIGTLGIGFKKRVSETQQFTAGAGVEMYNYTTYGFLRSPSFPIASKDLMQHITNIHLQSSLVNVAGEEGKIATKPTVRFDYITTNYRFTTTEIGLDIPIEFKWKKHIQLYTRPGFEWVNTKESTLSAVNTTLLKAPMGVHVQLNKFILNTNLQPTVFKNDFRLVPTIELNYKLKEKNLLLSGGYRNMFEINSFKKLFTINPYIRPSTNTPIYQKHSYYGGLNWFNTTGLQIKLEGAYVDHQGLPLFFNSGFLGKDFNVSYEASLKTIELTSEINYRVSDRLEWMSVLKWINFKKQIEYEKPFGMLPFEMILGGKWQPVKRLSMLFNTQLWAGSYAKNKLATSFVKTKGAADLNLDFDYKLNEKWGFWIDLNNIANIQYQRWNQYTAYGFNFRGGVKYIMGKTKKN
jgi:hypothetical protein